MTGEVTASRDNGRRRPKGYYDWRPQAKTLALLERVAEILDEYQDYLPLTVRQVFYRLVGAYDYPKTELAYDRLAEKLVLARRAQMIPFESIRDDGVVQVTERWYADQQDFAEQYARDAASYTRDRQQGQRYRLELWAEAAGMLPQLARVAHRYSIPVYSNSGFVSLTGVRMIVDRAIDSNVSTVLLHVGDFDPSGESIFEAMATDAQAFLEEDRTIASTSIIPVRVALTGDQVFGYGLATTPAKASDSRSQRWSGETCQLEALAPDALAEIIEDTILAWIDTSRLEQEIEHEEADRAALVLALGPGSES